MSRLENTMDRSQSILANNLSSFYFLFFSQEEFMGLFICIYRYHWTYSQTSEFCRFHLPLHKRIIYNIFHFFFYDFFVFSHFISLKILNLRSLFIFLADNFSWILTDDQVTFDCRNYFFRYFYQWINEKKRGGRDEEKKMC